MCEWLLERGYISSQSRAHEAAARGGRPHLMDWLISAYPERYGFLPKDQEYWAHMRRCLLASISEGCDLATLQRMHQAWFPRVYELGDEDGLAGYVYDKYWQVERIELAIVLAAAAGSRTPDWRAQVEWLEGRGSTRVTSDFDDPCANAAVLPDAAERLAWLRQRRHVWGDATVRTAARAGNLAALQFLHAAGAALPDAWLYAAHSGSIEVMAWLAETVDVGLRMQGGFLAAAATSGSVELLAWLRERGCPWDSRALTDAARAGSTLALEWLAERGCPMGDDGMAYVEACTNNDTTTLDCLARLGCPWGKPGFVWDWVVCNTSCYCMRVPTFRALLRAGCPLEWDRAALMVRYGRRPDQEQLLALLAEEQQRRRNEQQQ